MSKHLQILLVAVGCVVLVTGDASASWRQWRQGPSKEALAPQPVAIAKPGLRWRFPTGGAVSQVLVTDVDGDGDAELVSIEGGRVIARNGSGGVLWDTPPLQAVELVLVEDLDGTGKIEVLLRTKHTAAILAGATGELLWQSPTSLALDVWSVQIGDVQGDGKPEIALIDNSLNIGADATVSVFTFPNGLASGVLLAHTGKDCGGEAGRIFALADIDGDGTQEVVHSGRTKLCVWSATKDDDLIMQSQSVPDPMAAGELIAADVDGDGKDEIFVFTDWSLIDQPSRRVYAFQYDGEKLHLAWTRTAANPKDDRQTWPGRPLVDMDGDGLPEVATSFWEGGAWTGLVLDAWTGQPRAELPGRLLLDAADMDGDGAVDLLVALTTAPKPATYSDKAVVRLDPDTEEGPLSFSDLLTLPGSQVRIGPFPLPFGVGVGELMVARDVDADGVADLLDLRSLAQPGMTVTLGGAINGFQVFASSGEARAAVLYANGEVAILDSALALANDGNGDGHGDLSYGGFQARRVVGSDDSKDPTLLVPQSGGRLVLLDASLGTPVKDPPVLLAAQSNVAQLPFLLRLGPLGDGIGVLERSADGTSTLLVRTTTGATVSTTVLGGAGGTFLFPLDPLIHDADGDGVDEIYVLALDTSVGVVTHRLLAVDPLGGLLWAPVTITTPGGNVGGIGALTVGPYAPGLLLTASTRRVAVGALNGAVLYDSPAGVSHYYGQPVQTDLDGDGQDEVLILGTQEGALALEPDLSVRWVGTAGSALRGTGGVVPTDGAPIVAQARTQDMVLFFFDGADGSELGTVSLKGGEAVDPATVEPGAPVPAITDVVPVAQLGADGAPGFLVAADDGALYAIDAETRAVLWSRLLGGTLGAPALVDVDGDGEAEIAITVGTGHLVVVDESTVDPTSWVRENDGSGPATTDAADIDEQELGDRIHVNWAGVSGASSWVLRVYSQNGTVLTERQVLAPATSTTVDGLTLLVGQSYTTSVSTVKVSLDTVESADEVFSDGVTIVDLTGPSIAGLTALPGVFSPDGDGFSDLTVLSATAVDATRIATYELSIRHDGETVRQWSGIVGKAELALDVPWDGTGIDGAELPTATYDVELEVLDTVGNGATASTQVKLCRPPFKEELDACIGIAGPDAGPGPDADAGSTGDGGSTGDAGSTEDAAPNAKDVILPGADIQAPDGSVEDGTTGGSIPGLDTVGSDIEAASEGSDGCSCDQSGGLPLADAVPWLLLLGLLARRRSVLAHPERRVG